MIWPLPVLWMSVDNRGGLGRYVGCKAGSFLALGRNLPFLSTARNKGNRVGSAVPPPIAGNAGCLEARGCGRACVCCRGGNRPLFEGGELE